MTNQQSTRVLYFRWVVFVLALGYWVYRFFDTSLDNFGWQFRFLTVWGMTANVVVAWLMLRLSLGKSEKPYNAFVSATTVLGAMVMFLYWKLWFIDPALVNSGGPIIWHQEYYMHALGPLLMMFDAFFILGAFKRFLPSVATATVIYLAYIAWIEVLVAPLNESPVGKLTSGLPYPFLNDMDFNARMIFYASTVATYLVFFLAGWTFAYGLRRFRSG